MRRLALQKDILDDVDINNVAVSRLALNILISSDDCP
jgi:hypothetical protein